MISLLCQIINNYPEEKIIIESLICDIPNLSINKEGKISSAAAKVKTNLSKKEHNDENELSKKPFKSKELLDFAEYLKQTVLRIPTTASYIKSLEKTVNLLKENLTNFNDRYDLLKKDFDTLREGHIKKTSETEKFFNEKAKLELELV